MKTAYSYVRFSTPKQQWGDSERRQEQAAKDFCSRKGLTLSENNYADRGVSAKAGKNRAKGSDFYELLKVVKPGDYVLIDDNTRFSREDPITALSSLKEILSTKSITVVFLATGIEVTEDNFTDASVLLPNFLVGFTGYQENKTKSRNVKASWDKRMADLANGKAVKQKLPCWLEWKGDKVVIIPEKGEILKRIFSLYLKGYGTYRLCKELKNTPVITKHYKAACGWNNVTIHRFLSDKQVIGYTTQVTPEVKVYPAVIDEKTFYQVQATLANRKKNKFSGRASYAEESLFTGLVKCEVCGGNIVRHMDKGHNTFQCYNGMVGKCGCGYKQISCDIFEHSFFDTLIKQRESVGVFKDDSKYISRVADFNNQITATEKSLAKYLERFAEDPSRILSRLLKTTETKLDELRNQLEKEKGFDADYTPMDEAIDEIETMSDNRKSTEGRLILREQLRTIIDRITVNLVDRHYNIVLKGWTTLPRVELSKRNQKPGWTYKGKTYSYTSLDME